MITIREYFQKEFVDTYKNETSDKHCQQSKVIDVLLFGFILIFRRRKYNSGGAPR